MESWVLHSIGSVYSRKGDSTRACAYFEKVLQIHRAENNREREASTLMSLALESIHQPAKVRLYLQQAKTIYQERRDRPWEVDTLSQFGYLERRIGNKQAAEHSYQQAIALVESLRHGAGNGLSSQGAFFEGISYPYVGYLTLLVEEGRAGEAFALVQKTKARGLLDLMASGKIDLSRQLTQTEREQERQRRDRCDTLSTAMVREAARNEPGSKKRFEATRLELAKAERELSLFQDTLYAKHTGLGQHRGATTVDLAQVAKTLPANAALLEFAPLDNGQMALFVVTRSSQGKALVTMAQLAMSINELEGHITALRTACTSPKKPWQGEAKRLYQALLARVETRLRGKSQLILCPDRGLWDVPFAVLTDKTGTPLLERFALSYANSATTWHAAQTTPRKPSASPKLLVLANPQFDAEKRFENGPQVPGQRPITVPDRPITAPNRPITVPDRPITVPDRPITVPDRPLTVPDRDLYVPRGTKLVDLPGTQREADALAKRFPGATVYTRGKAQESVMKQSASQFQRIHLASHAFVNDAAPLLSSIVLANPTLGSGDDGFLTAREIFEIDLSGVELVVLSACNTARGAKRGGEGVVGLTWALFAAGCPTQVLSQWAVDDSSTATLMTYFYEGLAKGKGKSAALRQAALSLRKSAKYTHPYFWAPFVLIGDPH
ncbi:CHAT domain-containing protein [Armatimonas sp.]|uniref:CHAT domain-containing protein n=1 Tax=Armatimonas sp. TaxID=1872638 RepID=UPI00374D2173